MRPLAEVLASLGRPRMLVVGDLLLDRYLIGRVDRISPEAPIQVLAVENEEERLGGAGSVALNVAALGARTTLLGVVGEDEPGRRLARLAEDAGVALEAVADAGRRTSVKTRHLARSHSIAQQVHRVDEETTGPLAAATEAALGRRLDREVARADAVLLSDYGKGALTPGVLRAAIDAARAREIPVLVDPKGADFDRYRGATTVTPNRSETAAATGLVVDSPDAAADAARRLVDSLALDFALITLDREGMLLFAGGDAVHLPTTPREVFDVTGAGDMVLSVLGFALAAGASAREAAALANVAAGLEVERVGVVPVRREEIAARLAAADGAATKRVDRAEIGALCERQRAAGRRVVFTNGCFDVLHAGHVRYLAAAKAEGDVLVVGLNDDDGVRRLKGAGRPINPLDDRAEVLAALSSVDHVVVFEEDEPAALVEAVQPDVLVKGRDWETKGVVGRETVEGRGGRVVLVDLLEGRSTTGLVHRIRGGAGR